MGNQSEVATLAGGCFWCLEAVFDELKGVESVESGYSGGHVQSPSYAQVCDGDTGHAEAVHWGQNGIPINGNIAHVEGGRGSGRRSGGKD